MASLIQPYLNGSITKNQNGTYNYEVNGKVVSTHPSVKELVNAQGENGDEQNQTTESKPKSARKRRTSN